MSISFIILCVLLFIFTILFFVSMKKKFVRIIIGLINHILCIPLLVISIKHGLPYGIFILFLYLWFSVIIACIVYFIDDDDTKIEDYNDHYDDL